MQEARSVPFGQLMDIVAIYQITQLEYDRILSASDDEAELEEFFKYK